MTRSQFIEIGIGMTVLAICLDTRWYFGPSQQDLENQITQSAELVVNEFKSENIIKVSRDDLRVLKPFISKDPQSHFDPRKAPYALRALSNDLIDRQFTDNNFTIKSENKARVLSCSYAVFRATGVLEKELEAADTTKVARLLKNSTTEGQRIAIGSGWKRSCDRALSRLG